MFKYALLFSLMVVVGCSRPSTGLSDVALSLAVRGDSKIANEFARCELMYNQELCKKDALKKRGY